MELAMTPAAHTVSAGMCVFHSPKIASQVTLFYGYEEVRRLHKSYQDFIFEPLITTAK
jgi:hypothetical protein